MDTDRPDRLDRWIPWLMVATVLAVAVFAFVQSYTHVYYLGETHHQSGASLRMLPLSVDWLMFAAALVRLHLNRRQIKHWLPLGGLALGAIATLIANIASGIIWGWQTAAIQAWAPIVLFVTVELGMLLVRTAKAKELSELSPVAGPSVETMERILASLPAERKPRPVPPFAEPQPAPDPTPETTAIPRAVDSPEPALAGWGQLAGQEPAGQPEMLERRPGLTGIGLRNRGS